MLRLSERNLEFPIWDLRSTPDYIAPVRSNRKHTINPRITRLRLHNDFIESIENYWRAVFESELVYRNKYLSFLGTVLPDAHIDSIGCNLDQFSGGKVSSRGYLMI